MRALSAALSTHLERNAFLCADLFEFDVGGTTYRFTNASANLTGVSPAAAATYTAANIDRERIRTADGLQVDELEIAVCGSAELLGSKSWARTALDGDLDEAPVRVYRAYLDPTTKAAIGCYLRFSGVASTIDPGSTSVRIVVVVSANAFKGPFPSLAWSETCLWTLGGPGCDYVGTIDYNVTVGSQSGANWLHIAALPAGVAAAYEFAMGTITVAGVTRSIQNMWDYPDDPPFPEMVIGSGFGFWVSPAWDAVPVAGTTAVMRRGCMRFPNACETFYSNLTHHMGVRYPPAGA